MTQYRMCGANSPLFQHCQVYYKLPFSKKKYHHCYMNGPIFCHPCLKILIFLLNIFSSETKIVIFICKLCLKTAKRVYKNQRTLYEYVNILFNQVYEQVIFFEDQVLDWGRLQNTGSHTCTKITIKLHPPPPSFKCLYGYLYVNTMNRYKEKTNKNKNTKTIDKKQDKKKNVLFFKINK